MKGIRITLMTLTAAACLCASCATLSRAQKHVVAVPVLSDGTSSKLDRALRASITDQFITDLIKSRKYAIVERTRIDELMAEHKLEMSGLLKTDDAIKIGQLVKAPHVVLAQVATCEVHRDRIGTDMAGVELIVIEIELTARIIETERGVSVAAGKSKVTEKKKLIHVKAMVDGSEKKVLQMGGDPKNLDPAIKAAFTKAAKLLADDLVRQKW